MKQFICLLLFYGCTFSQSRSFLTMDYFFHTICPVTLRFPVIPGQTDDDSTAHTFISTDYHFNQLFYERVRASDTLRHEYSCGAHTWNLEFVHRNSRWRTFAAWRQHAFNVFLAPENEYETSVVFPRHHLVLGGERTFNSFFSAQLIAAANPLYLNHIAKDNTIDGIRSLATAFATPAIDVTTMVRFRSRFFSGALMFENRSPFSNTSTILNTTNTSRRTLHLTVNENRFGTGITFDRAMHHLSFQGFTGIIDSSRHTFSDAHYPLIAKGNAYHTTLDYSIRMRHSPRIALSYDHYHFSLKGFDNIDRPFSRLNGTNVSLFNGVISLQKNRVTSYGAFCILFSSDNSSGSVELYPFSSWITLISLNRYYLTAARSRWREYGVFLQYLREIASRHTVSGELALSESHLEAAATTAEGRLAFEGLLLVKENEKHESLDKDYILIKTAFTYQYRLKQVTPRITVQQYIPIEIKKGSRSGTPFSTSSDVKKTVFGGFQFSISLSRDIPARK